MIKYLLFNPHLGGGGGTLNVKFEIYVRQTTILKGGIK
jgi:hypothetical protein